MDAGHASQFADQSVTPFPTMLPQNPFLLKRDRPRLLVVVCLKEDDILAMSLLGRRQQSNMLPIGISVPMLTVHSGTCWNSRSQVACNNIMADGKTLCRGGWRHYAAWLILDSEQRTVNGKQRSIGSETLRYLATQMGASSRAQGMLSLDFCLRDRDQARARRAQVDVTSLRARVYYIYIYIYVLTHHRSAHPSTCRPCKHA